MTSHGRRKRHSSLNLSSNLKNEGNQLELTAFLPTREQLGVRIATAGDSIRKITKNFYKVRSQKSDCWYNVKKLQDANIWSCDCKDFLYGLSKEADKRCKHIIGVQTLQKTFDTESKIEPLVRPQICPKCSTADIVKHGFRIVKGEVKRQRYQCLRCKYRFILGENGFSKVSSNPQMITESLNLILAGMSYRNTARHISISHQIKISHTSIANWFKKYVQLMKDYVDRLIPEYQEVWSVDEMMINVKNTEPTGIGYYNWMWSIISPQTKFVIASEISKRREVDDASALFESGKIKVESNPSYIITDSLRTYEPAFRKEFDYRRTAHIKTKSISEGFANRAVERYNNEVRAVIKSKRGLGNDKSSQRFADGQRIYHNYCRPHMGLPNNITPAQAAGIDLKLGDNKIKSLINKSAEAKEQAKKEYNIRVQLGKRVELLNIIDDEDCISVKTKGWIDKHIWREINDILSINGFGWLESGKGSSWIKMKEQRADKGAEIEQIGKSMGDLRSFGF